MSKRQEGRVDGVLARVTAEDVIGHELPRPDRDARLAERLGALC
jgi:hypothetical protein